jgi:glycosyltransferase involved in cell wall biosynthesis
MKIAVIQDSIDTPGGVESYLSAVIPALRARGHSIALVYLERRGGPALIDGIDGPAIEAARDAGTAIASLRAWGVDLCFSNNMREVDLEARLIAEWPVVKFMHGYFGTCVSALKMHAFPSRVACERRLGAACLALYGPRRCGPLRPAAFLRGYRFAHGMHRLLGQYARVVVGSRHMAREFERNGVVSARLALVPQFAPPVWPTTERERTDVLFLGRMTHLKGGDLLVRAAAAASATVGRPLPLVMAGDGPQRDSWMQLAHTLGVGAAFPGWLSAAERDAALARAAVLVVPSLWPEPFGLVGLEAAAAGVPAVAFDTGGIRQWLHHDRNGVLVQPTGSADALAAALHQLLTDDVRRSRLGAEALRVAREMSLDAHVDGLQRVFEEACIGAAARRP